MCFQKVMLGVLMCLVLPALALAELDENMNYISEEQDLPTPPGEPCGQCPAPAEDDAGLTFKDGDLWVLGRTGTPTLYRLVECAVVETIPLAPTEYGFGLGWDSSRNVFIITDAYDDVLFQVDMDGHVVNTWPTPGDVPVGAAYDPTRDLYWISDSGSDRMTSIDPNTGLVGPSLPVPAGTRIAGTGYDVCNDAILYNGRDQGNTYWMSAEDGALLAVYPNPGGPGINNGQGAAINPETADGWVSHYEQPSIFCIEGLGHATATEASTWGGVKQRYR